VRGGKLSEFLALDCHLTHRGMRMSIITRPLTSKPPEQNMTEIGADPARPLAKNMTEPVENPNVSPSYAAFPCRWRIVISGVQGAGWDGLVGGVRGACIAGIALDAHRDAVRQRLAATQKAGVVKSSAGGGERRKESS
jgi:hypothetical protein